MRQGSPVILSLVYLASLTAACLAMLAGAWVPAMLSMLTCLVLLGYCMFWGGCD